MRADGQLPQGGAGGRVKKLIEVLIYFLEQGPVEKKLLSQAISSGAPIPPKMANAPDLMPGLSLYLHAFTELSDGREEGKPLAWDLIDRWCRVHDILGETRELVFHHLKALDKAFLMWKPPGTKSKGSRGG